MTFRQRIIWLPSAAFPDSFFPDLMTPRIHLPALADQPAPSVPFNPLPLDEPAAHHLLRVLRRGIGDEIEVFDIEEDYDSETPDQDSPMTTGEQADAVADAPADDTEAPGEPAEASTDMAADLDAADQDDDAEWSQSFAERVEAEMAELLEEAGEASASPSDATDETTTMTTSADDAPEEPR